MFPSQLHMQLAKIYHQQPNLSASKILLDNVQRQIETLVDQVENDGITQELAKSLVQILDIWSAVLMTADGSLKGTKHPYSHGFAFRFSIAPTSNYIPIVSLKVTAFYKCCPVLNIQICKVSIVPLSFSKSRMKPTQIISL